jgi:hypothetical protein
MTFSRSRFASVATLLVTARRGGNGSEPVATDPPEPTQTPPSASPPDSPSPSFGFTRRVPPCCPELLVTKTVALKDGELVKTELTKEPYRARTPWSVGCAQPALALRVSSMMAGSTLPTSPMMA